MSRLRWTKFSVRMWAMLASVPVSRLSTQITRWPRRSSSSHRCEPRNPAPPVTRLVGMASNLAGSGRRGARSARLRGPRAHDVHLAAAHRDASRRRGARAAPGRTFARSPARRAAAARVTAPSPARSQREHPPRDLGEHVGVVVQRAGHAGSASPCSRRAARSAASSSASSGGSKPAARRALAPAPERCPGSGCRRRRQRTGPAALRGRGVRRRSPRASALQPGEQVAPWAVLARAVGSSTVPPPSVSGGAIWRIDDAIARAGRGRGASERSCQKRPPSQARRAGVSRVPWCAVTRSPCSGSCALELKLGVEQVRGRECPTRRGTSTSPRRTSLHAHPG